MALKDKLKSNFKKVTKWDYENTIKKVKDTSNFEIDKQGRFAARFFQIALSVISYYFFGSQNSVLLKRYELGGTVDTLIIFAALSPIISGSMVAVYLTPWFGKNWTSRRILSIETLSDFCMTFAWLGGFIALVSKTGGGCGSSVTAIDGCGVYNWLAAWVFFLLLAWAAGLFFDCTAWRRGVFSGNDIEDAVLLDVRRATRGTSRL